MKKQKKFWNWKNQTGTNEGQERVLELYGTIAETSWFDDDVTPKMFHDELFAGSGPVTVWLNSPGGDCIAASQIYTMLMDYQGDVTVKIDGIAASAASVIAIEDMEKAIEMLDEVKESIINAYEIKTSMSRAKLSHLMDSETWMNANKAIELGFADDILVDEKKSADDIPAYAFSGKETETRLMNKLMTHFKPKDEAVKKTPAQAAVIPAEKPANVTMPVNEEETGTSIEELEKRLSLIKP